MKENRESGYVFVSFLQFYFTPKLENFARLIWLAFFSDNFNIPFPLQDFWALFALVLYEDLIELIFWFN